MPYYAGIGSRETPSEILNIMNQFAIAEQANTNLILRSGAAKGADTAFARSIDQNRKEIFTAKDEIPEWAFQSVYKYHPHPMSLSDYAKRLHARNAMILLGANGDVPVDYIICWTSNGADKGGTGQAIRIGWDLGITIYNLHDKQTKLNIEECIRCQVNVNSS